MSKSVTKKTEHPSTSEHGVLMGDDVREHTAPMDKPMTRSTMTAPNKVFVRALVQPSTFNKDENTVEVIVSQGAAVLRFDWWEGAYFWEELSLDPSHVRMERLESGQCPVLKDHNSRSIDNQIGVVLEARIEGNDLIAKVRLSDNPDHAGIVGDIQKGIIRNISVGYTPWELTETKAGPDGIPVLRVTDWEPHEVSFVTVPADAGAGVRSMENEQKHPCTVIRVQPENQGETNMTEAEKAALAARTAQRSEAAPAPAPAAQPVDVEAVRAEAAEAATKAELNRQAEIRRIAAGLGMADEAEDLITKRTKLEDAQRVLLDKAIARSAESKAEGSSITRVSVTGADNKRLRSAMENAISNRASSRFQNEKCKVQLTEDGRDFVGLRLMEMAREFLRINGVETRGMSPGEVALRVMTTTDFPLLLSNVASKSMRSGYEYAPNTFEPLVKRGTLPDFKKALRGQLGDAPRLRKQNENGETRRGSIGEAGEYIKLETYTASVSLTRQTIINDDMDALSRLPEAMGMQARQLEGDLVWGTIINNTVMNDGNAMFSSAHNNLLTGAGSALDPSNFASVDAARSAIRKQKSLDGQTRIRNVPDLLIVPTELESKADRMVGAIQPATAANVNPYGPNGRTPLTVIVEDRLADLASYGSTAWYMASSTGMDKIELATLEGENGPQILTDTDIDVDGSIIKILHDVGVSPLDYRWITRSNGAS